LGLDFDRRRDNDLSSEIVVIRANTPRGAAACTGDELLKLLQGSREVLRVVRDQQQRTAEKRGAAEPQTIEFVVRTRRVGDKPGFKLDGSAASEVSEDAERMF
jgi:hypothetical protein